MIKKLLTIVAIRPTLVKKFFAKVNSAYAGYAVESKNFFRHKMH